MTKISARALRRARLAIGIVFLVNGAVHGTAKDHLLRVADLAEAREVAA